MISTTLRYFLEVANLGSVTLASETLHVAPSAVSRRIHALEAQHGTSLFERNARGMRLTEAGELMAVYVRRALLDAEKLTAELSDLSRIGKTLIRVATNEGFGREFLPHVMGEFLKVEPNVRFELYVAKRGETSKMIKRGEVDVGMTYALAPVEGVNVIYTRRAPLYAIMSPRHPLAQYKEVSLRDIAPHTVVIYADTNSTRALVDYCCMHEKIELDYVLTSNYSGALQHFIRDFDALTLSGTLTVTHAIDRGDVVAIPVKNADLYDRTIQIHTMQGRDLPHSIERFIALIIEMADASHARHGPTDQQHGAEKVSQAALHIAPSSRLRTLS
jgi:DNA-binding transcriptional LysR family regulator